MKNKKMMFGVIVLLMIFLIPFGQCAETKTRYLSSFGSYVGISLDVIEGDVIRGDYRTYNSPFDVGIGWEYLGVADAFTSYYESGWFEITISEGSGVIDIVLMNADIWTTGGYIEYTVSNPKGEAREEEELMTMIIIGVVVGIISICVIAGIISHFKKKEREGISIPVEQREYITAPKPIFSSSKMSFIKTEYESNKSIQDIANNLGMSMMAVKKYIDEIKKRKAEIIQVQEVIKSKSFYCSNCGAENIDITRDYCSKCGSKIIK